MSTSNEVATGRVADPSSGGPTATRILTVCPFVPHAELPHAGGQYLYAHMSALQTRYACEMIVPDTPDNQAALRDGGHRFNPTLAEPRSRSRVAVLDTVLRLADGILRPLRPEAQFTASLLRALEDRLDDVDVVELQWPEYAGLLPAIRRRAPHLPVVVVEHDVLSQRVLRATKTAPSPRSRLRASLTARRVARLEKLYLDQADQVLVFSDKDVQLLRAGGVTSPIEVLLPPLEETGMSDARPARAGGDPRILFVAAFDREVNDAAARWFIREIFPRVREQVPRVRLVLAGGRARDGLKTLAEATPGVEMTGFVADLGRVYREADVAVVPLLAGAGLKFKVAVAMMWGLPVVATTVGAEGYPRERGLFAGIEDDADDFASAVAATLDDPTGARARAATGQAWALSAFSQQAFEAHLHAIYAPVIARLSHPGPAPT